MTRDQKLAAVWRNTPKDYRGEINGEKNIMAYREGTKIVPLSCLTDEEIESRLPCK